MKNVLLGKAMAIAAITLLLLLGLGHIADLVDERRQRQQEAQWSVEQGQAGRQTLLGPVLHRSCTEEWDTPVGEGAGRKLVTSKREVLLAAVPDQLTLHADAALEARYRGLFKVNSYAAKTRLQARWADVATLQPKAEHAGSRLQCQAPVLMVALSDARGIRVAQVQADGQRLDVKAGTGHPAYPRGFHAVLPAAPESGAVQADVTLELVGTGEFSLAPVAHHTQVELRSDWPHPSFGGRFLPAQREVDQDGFRAEWRVSSLATTAPADVLRGAPLCPSSTGGNEPEGGCIEAFGVSFIDPVNPYVLGDRATKYGVLFIALTFVTVAMVELLKKRRVHPVQYLLVGCALVLFFLLLLSLSEHFAFGLAYAGASTACAALLAYYASHMLGGWRAGLGFGAAVGTLYGALYLLLQMEQTALVIGSLLLFAVLALIMVLTRRLDWYGLSGTLNGRPGAAPPASEGQQ
ncbi:cell envelope integrity protein CreD [Schlegelella sp. S2-27]|uniref:Cell envelope integrity protein CreD n=1 Tax=Caldimonas mangrovi TaxID=2944811 RepID=A0ABT0YXC4_9BURK|nr:cell envelope integrity protein CreD [Caldimonas mangrovi]MCM5682488.1 cell envelope integrity protein CreD [Caldimonas mangrovi]